MERVGGYANLDSINPI
ncbi:uncharacterized protein G2W53_036571 [Senna tora]|uniref:Uncharacterized protein n=1 Tax=Senna tora TaxID=362788 RepID=A0A834SSV8_9FABA|nr:uncharacterized protein G2W53_036571 [Senna tora]